MQNTEIIILLKTFSEEEIKTFKKFVTKKEYNKKRLSKELLFYIYQTKPDFEGEKLDKENAQAFFKKKKNDIDDGYLRQMLSILSQYAQDFLVENELKEQQVYKLLLLKKALNKKGFTKMPQKAWKQIESKSAEKLSNGILDFYEDYLFTSYKHELATQKNNQQKGILFSDIAKAFDKYAIAQQLKNACVLLNNQRLLATADYQIDIDCLIKQAEKQDTEQEIIIKLYYLLLLVLTDKAEEKNWKILLATLDKAFVGAIPAQVGIPVHFKILFFINIP